MRTAILGLVIVTLCLAGCGKRPRFLDPPPGDPVVQYPKHYPPPDTPGTHL
jgi:hypothetical protein